MPQRLHLLLFAPVAAMLLVHVSLLVTTAQNRGQQDPWGTWNLAAPVLLLIAAGYALRHATDPDSPHTHHRLTQITWIAAGADLVLTGIFALIVFG